MKAQLRTLFVQITLMFVLGCSGYVMAQESSWIPIPLRQEFFQSEDFRKRFLYSYAPDSRTEPTINTEEKELFDLLKAQIEQNNIDLAITTVRAGITPESSAALDFTLGNLYFEKDQHTAAIQSYRNAIGKFSNFRRAHNLMGKIHVRLGKTEIAIKHFVKAIELGDASGDLFGLLGYCYLRVQRIDAALAAYQQALMFDPKSNDWKLGKVQCLLNLQKWDESIALFEELLAESPDRQEYWLLQANAYLGLGRSMQAAANYEVLRRLGKATPDSLFQLGDIYINEDLADLAYAVYLEGLKSKEKVDVRRPIRVASILASRASWKDASNYIESIRRAYGSELKDKNELELLSLESEISLAEGETEKAVDILKQIIERDPLNCKSLLLLAGFQGKAGEVEESVFHYEAAQEIRECQYQAFVEQAQMHVARSEFCDAVPLLKKALDVENSDNVDKYSEAVNRACISSNI
ncbi:MAG: Lipopolysaccharide assembly protein B [Candidatus Moanabacter tarae]|mgnify:CR=1 FL=1|uniref:Lipopolysaccharide assembly protein B n=1 Tax=Candidatus Moanibacter tarae TaxID=2200854 RepID=A0A2Z4ALW4_9BACT|nr:MAG: Lipopolysaccharide assembly protein B [Candidatus Moanabacter tarae]